MSALATQATSSKDILLILFQDMDDQDLVSSGGSDDEVDPEDTGLKVSDRSTTPISCGATDNEDTDPVFSPG